MCVDAVQFGRPPLAALLEFRRLLTSGGRLVLLVPAFQFLYGSVDRALGHCRRYTKGELVLNREDQIVQDTLVTHDGQVVNKKVSDLLGKAQAVTL